MSFDAKRDRWLGYHPDEHKHTIDRFNKIDQERRRARREEAEKQEERRKVRGGNRRMLHARKGEKEERGKVKFARMRDDERRMAR